MRWKDICGIPWTLMKRATWKDLIQVPSPGVYWAAFGKVVWHNWGRLAKTGGRTYLRICMEILFSRPAPRQEFVVGQLSDKRRPLQPVVFVVVRDPFSKDAGQGVYRLGRKR